MMRKPDTNPVLTSVENASFAGLRGDVDNLLQKQQWLRVRTLAEGGPSLMRGSNRGNARKEPRYRLARKTSGDKDQA